MILFDSHWNLYCPQQLPQLSPSTLNRTQHRIRSVPTPSQPPPSPLLLHTPHRTTRINEETNEGTEESIRRPENDSPEMEEVGMVSIPPLRGRIDHQITRTRRNLIIIIAIIISTEIRPRIRRTMEEGLEDRGIMSIDMPRRSKRGLRLLRGDRIDTLHAL